MSFYDYINSFNLNDFTFLSVIVKKVHDDFDWDDLVPVIAVATYDVDLIFDLYGIFDNLSIISISHDVISSSNSLYLRVLVNE